jgi:hypothetical protein
MIFMVAHQVIGLLMCWFYWRLAGSVAATAGGTTGSMLDWSQVQWTLARLMAATVVLNIAAIGWDVLVLFLT